MYEHGWYQVGYERDMVEPITPIELGDMRLIAVRNEQGITVFGADCPHRGAHLGFGGRLDGCGVVCPFHGYKIALGGDESKTFRVPEYKTIVLGGLVFVRLSDSHDSGFEAFTKELERDYAIAPGFVMHVDAPAQLVIENGFDNRHFPAVHGIQNDPVFEVEVHPAGKVIVRSEFEVPATPAPVPYEAHTFSPGLITVHLTGETPYSVITGAKPNKDGSTTIHLSLALPKAIHGETPNAYYVKNLLEHSRRGLEDDQVMWEQMSFAVPHNYTAQDHAILAFHEFCQSFGLPLQTA